jgi:hypothetical protein
MVFMMCGGAGQFVPQVAESWIKVLTRKTTNWNSEVFESPAAFMAISKCVYCRVIFVNVQQAVHTNPSKDLHRDMTVPQRGALLHSDDPRYY